MASRSINVPPEGGNYRNAQGSSPSSLASVASAFRRNTPVSVASAFRRNTPVSVASAFRRKTPVSVASAFRRNITVLAIGLAIGATVIAQVPADRSQAEALARRAADRMAALQREADALAN